MKISVCRTDWRHRTTVERDDGIMFEVPAYGPERPFPRDLAHAVVESALRLPDGVWGTMANGGILPGMIKTAGREQPDATARSLSVLQANRLSLVMADVLVDILTKTLRDDGTGDIPSALAELYERAVEISPPTAELLVRIYAELHSMREQWTALPIGSSIDIEWPIGPTDKCRMPSAD